MVVVIIYFTIACAMDEDVLGKRDTVSLISCSYVFIIYLQVIDKGIARARAAVIYVMIGLSGHMDEFLAMYKVNFYFGVVERF